MATLYSERLKTQVVFNLSVLIAVFIHGLETFILLETVSVLKDVPALKAIKDASDSLILIAIS